MPEFILKLPIIIILGRLKIGGGWGWRKVHRCPLRPVSAAASV